MKKGKLYIGKSTRIIILCTGAGKAKHPSFSGTVVQNPDPLSSMQQGDNAGTWAMNSFEEYDKAVNLRSKDTTSYETC